MMNKFIILLLLLTNSFWSFGQVLESDKCPFWDYPDTFIFSDEQGETLIEINDHFRRNRQLKRQAKALKVNGRTYQIVRKGGSQYLYQENEDLIAKIDWSNRVLHFVKEGITFRRKVKPLKEEEVIVDDQGTPVIRCEPIRGQRKYRLTKLGDTAVNTELLMALTFHLFIELEYILCL